MLFSWYLVGDEDISPDPKTTCLLSAKGLPGLCASLWDIVVMPGEELAPGPALFLAGAMSITMPPSPTVIQQRTLH